MELRPFRVKLWNWDHSELNYGAESIQSKNYGAEDHRDLNYGALQNR